jgi:hypothetical protein
MLRSRVPALASACQVVDPLGVAMGALAETGFQLALGNLGRALQQGERRDARVQTRQPCRTPPACRPSFLLTPCTPPPLAARSRTRSAIPPPWFVPHLRNARCSSLYMHGPWLL